MKHTSLLTRFAAISLAAALAFGQGSFPSEAKTAEKAKQEEQAASAETILGKETPAEEAKIAEKEAKTAEKAKQKEQNRKSKQHQRKIVWGKKLHQKMRKMQKMQKMQKKRKTRKMK
ncbi:MAG: hypothetical protein IJU50_05420 [Lachnospiraceae bacterium]|nr:hypothetical protein [Lachnospiraceae bacterium]